MEFILLAGVNAAVWTMAYKHHIAQNSGAQLYDRGLGDRSNPGLGVNELYNPETNKLTPSTRRTAEEERDYRRRLRKRPTAAPTARATWRS